MNELKFNSQIGTTIEQSKRLLELGLKPETADMSYYILDYEPVLIIGMAQVYRETIKGGKIIGKQNAEIIPAWSLHRLIEIRFAADDIGFSVYNIHNRNFGSCYEILISAIEYLIDIGKFNKEYLKQ